MSVAMPGSFVGDQSLGASLARGWGQDSDNPHCDFSRVVALQSCDGSELLAIIGIDAFFNYD